MFSKRLVLVLGTEIHKRQKEQETNETRSFTQMGRILNLTLFDTSFVNGYRMRNQVSLLFKPNSSLCYFRLISSYQLLTERVH